MAYENNNNNNNGNVFVDLSHKAYNVYSGTLKYTPMFESKPGLLLQLAKAINPGVENTPCDWNNTMFFSLTPQECCEIQIWARDAKAGAVENYKTFHKKDQSRKSFTIAKSDKGQKNTFYVTVSEGKDNYISIGLSGSEWYLFVSTCKFICDNAIGIRALLGEIAKINKGVSYYNNVWSKQSADTQQKPKMQNNNGYQPKKQFTKPVPAPVQNQEFFGGNDDDLDI